MIATRANGLQKSETLGWCRVTQPWSFYLQHKLVNFDVMISGLVKEQVPLSRYLLLGRVDVWRGISITPNKISEEPGEFTIKTVAKILKYLLSLTAPVLGNVRKRKLLEAEAYG